MLGTSSSTIVEVNTFTIKSPWRKMVIDNVITLVNDPCIFYRPVYCYFTTFFAGISQNWKMISSINFFCQGTITVKASSCCHWWISRSQFFPIKFLADILTVQGTGVFVVIIGTKSGSCIMEAVFHGGLVARTRTPTLPPSLSLLFLSDAAGMVNMNYLTCLNYVVELEGTLI